MSKSWLVLAAVGTGVMLAPPSASAQRASASPWRIQVALVVGDLDVKPVPLYTLRLVGQPDTSLVIPARTGLDGLAEGVAPAGSYLVVGESPARANGLAYSWRVPLTVVAGKLASLELTNANATVDSTIAQDLARGGRQIEDAVVTYRRVRRGVFRVEAGVSMGSGFLVDSAKGLVVTNAHVVSGELSASVVLDSVTRVPAVVLARSENADVAVLWVDPRALTGRPSLTLPAPQSKADLVEEGERVFAIGYPLNQEQVLTTGIVSGIRDGAIISDVNINHGNSGGPMLNYAGVVVGINSFGDFTDQGGPGISGAIVSTSILPVLELARLAMATTAPPEFRLLPTMPLTSYPLAALQSYVATLPASHLKPFHTDANGRFDVLLSTPVTIALSQQVHDQEVARDRRKREAAAGLSPEQQYNSLADVRDWYRFTGDMLTPVAQLTISPKIGETTGSILGRALVAGLSGYNGTATPQTQATMTFKGDVQSVQLYRNGVLVMPIRGGTGPVEEYVNNEWISLKDVASVGYYLLDPLIFAPDTLGTPPSIVIVVNDLKHQGKPSCREASQKVVAYAWNDFRPYMETIAPDIAATVADPSRKPALFTKSRVPGDTVVTTQPDKTWKVYWPNCPSVTY